jgi:ATP-binding cassette subfamily F protein uup
MVVFEGDGRITHSVGDYEYYLEKKSKADAQSQSSRRDPVESKSKLSNDEPSRPRKLKFKEQQELAGMEAAIQTAESEVARLEALFASPDFYKQHEQFYEFKEQLETAKAKVAAMYARWEELENINKSAVS